MTRQELLTRLGDNVARVEQALVERFAVCDRENLMRSDEYLHSLKEAQDYSLLGGGKRIRASLVLESCRLLDGDETSALGFACALEMIHAYSLIHDDLPCMDDDDLRRGKPTSHKVFGEATAILAGDSLLTDAFLVASSQPDEQAALRAVRVLARAAGSMGMVGGQLMDLRGESEQLSMQTLCLLHARKTGALIRAAVHLGAIAAGCDEQSDTWRALTTYADRIGLAFQVIDDILDVTADPILLGKSKGKDKKENKTTFLTYYTVEEARDYARRLTDEAITAVAPLDSKGILKALALYLAERVY